MTDSSAPRTPETVLRLEDVSKSFGPVNVIKEVTIPDTKTSEALGIATIHQELNLVPTMSVAENIMLGRTPRK